MENTNDNEQEKYIKIELNSSNKLIDSLKTNLDGDSRKKLLNGLGIGEKIDIRNNAFQKFATNYKNAIFSLITPEFIEVTTNPFIEMIKKMADEHKKLMQSLMSSILPGGAFDQLSKTIDEAKKNPNSVYSWMNYYDKMSEFFWIMPYKMTAEEMNEILSNITEEKEFDKYARKYFTKKKVNELICEIKDLGLKGQDLRLFEQIIMSYKNRAYALANIGLISIIDKLLSFYLINKGKTNRVGLFNPIIHKIASENDNNHSFSYILMMINSSINLLYDDIDFNYRIVIKTNKKSRRNPVAHGRAYSNKRIDTIMLLNIVYYLLVAQKELYIYKDSLCYKNKEFTIVDKKEKKEIKQAIKKKKIKN